MNLSGTLFGDIEFGPSDVIIFKDGLIGLPNLQEFVLVHHKDGSPFRWLQSVQVPAKAFLCAIPQHFVKDYDPVVGRAAAKALGLTDKTNRLILATASIPSGKPSDMTLNLAAPILINADTHAACQVVLEGEAYTVKHRVFPEAKKKVAA